MSKGTETQIAERLRELKSRGDPVLRSHTPNPPNVIGFPTLDSGLFTGWRTQCLTYLRSVFGDDHTYAKSFEDSTNQHGHTSEVKRGMAVLEAAAEDVESGYLTKITDLITSDVFTNFLEHGEHLLDAGYKDPAAMVVGAILEDGLRRIAQNAGQPVKSRDDLSALNARCASKGVYNRLVQKKVAVWIDIRNNADHGKFAEYSKDDVKLMIDGVTQFLSERLT